MNTIAMPGSEENVVAESAGAAILVVDLDGTLVRTDLLVESSVALMVASPGSVVQVALWLTRGKAHFKERVAERVDIDAASLPYHGDFLAYLRAERARGRKLWLATGSHRKFAEAVARHLGIFERVLATESGVNLTGPAKRDALLAALAGRSFDYAGNDRADLDIWPRARRALLVHPQRGVEEAASRRFAVERVFPRERNRGLAGLRAIRTHQWIKNLLLFVPLVLAHRANEWPLVGAAAMGFVAFNLAASSAYVLNDLVDVASDRRHPRKRGRPFAAGDLAPTTALWLVPLLILGSVAVCSRLPLAFAATLSVYLAMTLAYSFQLKRYPMVDVMSLASLYALRIVAGCAATGIVPTFWLLAFSIFIFLSLALVKRCSELALLQHEGREATMGRGYRVDDRPILSAAGVASGYVAALVLALYVNSPEVLRLYRTPEVIWLLCPLVLFWVSYVWLLAHRGEMHDDPVVFALTDGLSLAIGAVAVVIVIGATL